MEKVFEFKDEITFRFQSGCMEPQCALDVEVSPNDLNFNQFTFWDVANSWQERLRWCWKMLRTGLGYRHEFFLRAEDKDDLIRLIIRDIDLGKYREKRD
jgi:hypothetical protein